MKKEIDFEKIKSNAFDTINKIAADPDSKRMLETVAVLMDLMLNDYHQQLTELD